MSPPTEVTDLLHSSSTTIQCQDLVQQCRDRRLKELIDYLECGDLPEEGKTARRIALQKPQFILQEIILYHKQEYHKRVAIPEHLREQLLTEYHSSLTGGHFGVKTCGTLIRQRWWDGMYSDVVKLVTNCPECTIVTGGGRHHRAPLHPIPVSRPFQIVGVDVNKPTVLTSTSWSSRTFSRSGHLHSLCRTRPTEELSYLSQK